MLIIAQLLAEGGLLAVVAAAIQALAGQPPQVGPLELAIVAGAGMGWARRSRWHGSLAESVGTPLLAVVGGIAIWLLDPAVSAALTAGHPEQALGEHPGGWIGALAVLRGAAHRSADYDEETQDRVLRWGLVVVAVSWLVGTLAASAEGAPAGARAAFESAALFGTITFAAAGLVAASLARMAAVGSDTPARPRSWAALTVGLAAAVIVLGLVSGAVLGVPVQAFLYALVGPARLLLVLILALGTPLAVAGGWLAERLHTIIPSITLPRFTLPNLGAGVPDTSTPIPAMIFFIAVGILLVLELAVVILYLRFRSRLRASMAEERFEVGEERSVVRPPLAPTPVPAAGRPRRLDPADPVDAYLLALQALAPYDPLARAPSETPAAHAHRLASASAPGPALSRLAAAYQLVRYGSRELAPAERHRSGRRVGIVRESLRRETLG